MGTIDLTTVAGEVRWGLVETCSRWVRAIWQHLRVDWWA